MPADAIMKVAGALGDEVLAVLVERHGELVKEPVLAKHTLEWHLKISSWKLLEYGGGRRAPDPGSGSWSGAFGGEATGRVRPTSNPICDHSDRHPAVRKTRVHRSDHPRDRRCLRHLARRPAPPVLSNLALLGQGPAQARPAARVLPTVRAAPPQSRY